MAPDRRKEPTRLAGPGRGSPGENPTQPGRGAAARARSQGPAPASRGPRLRGARYETAPPRLLLPVPGFTCIPSPAEAGRQGRTAPSQGRRARRPRGETLGGRTTRTAANPTSPAAGQASDSVGNRAAAARRAACNRPKSSNAQGAGMSCTGIWHTVARRVRDPVRDPRVPDRGRRTDHRRPHHRIGVRRGRRLRRRPRPWRAVAQDPNGKGVTHRGEDAHHADCRDQQNCEPLPEPTCESRTHGHCPLVRRDVAGASQRRRTRQHMGRVARVAVGKGP